MEKLIGLVRSLGQAVRRVEGKAQQREDSFEQALRRLTFILAKALRLTGVDRIYLRDDKEEVAFQLTPGSGWITRSDLRGFSGNDSQRLASWVTDSADFASQLCPQVADLVSKLEAREEALDNDIAQLKKLQQCLDEIAEGR